MTMQKFLSLQKVDLEKRQVWGYAAIEQPDGGKPPEIMDYAKSKPNFERWSKTIEKASQGKSLGNVRAMHGGQLMAVGRVIEFDPRDVEKAIYVGVEIVDDAAWEKVQKGVYSGFSIGGRYGEKWSDPLLKGAVRYEAIPTEISLVDSPCIPDATFEVIKADGSNELRKFANPNEDTANENQSAQAESTDKTAEPASEPNQQPDSASSEADGQTEPDGDEAELDVEAVKAIVIDLLMSLGLVEAKGAQPMSMAMRMDEMQKQIGETKTWAQTLRPNETADLQKALSDQKTAFEGQIETLKKTISSDLAQIAISVETLEKRGSSGPVLRDLGAITPQAMAEMQKATVLKDMLKRENDPTTRQALQAEITRLEIKAVQTQPAKL